MCSRFTLIIVTGLALSTAPVGAQDLAELARKERARRAAAGPVRYSIDNITNPGESDSTPPPSASQVKEAGLKTRGPAALEQKPSAASRDKRLDDLARRGPIAWFELKKLNQRLAGLEKELTELERTRWVW